MPHASPARAGFDVVIRRPVLIFAEITWRWCFGLASLILLALTCGLFFASIRVTDADMQLARSGSPWLAADVLARLLQANKAPLLRSLAVLVPGIAILWTIAAAVGRMITTPPLLRAIETWEGHGRSEHRAEPAATPSAASAVEGRIRNQPNFSALLGIGFLRAALILALVAGYFGCALIAAAVSNLAGGDPAAVVRSFLLVFLPLFLLVMVAWGILNWLFSIASIFAVRDGRSTLASFADTVRLFSGNKRDFIAIGSAYGLAKTIAVIVVTVMGIVLAGALSDVPRLLTVVVIALTLAYFAFADLLNLARLASYAVLAEASAPEPAGQTTSA